MPRFRPCIRWFRGSFCGLRTVRAIESSRLKILIEEFATYERLSAVIREQQLRQDRFGPKFRMLIVEVDPQPAGYALFFDCYSSFQGRGVFLEDPFVRPQFRGKECGGRCRRVLLK